tara:strand:- start:279 stop:455 length:177 start_codon:yes stop_codon:yes gene_type:complete
MGVMLQLHFWVSFFSTVALIAIPIVMVGRAKPFRSFLAALVIYIGIIIVAACNVSGPF